MRVLSFLKFMSSLQVCMHLRFGPPLTYDKVMRWKTASKKGLLRFLRALLGVRSSTPSWSVLRECGAEALQLNWLRACARLYNNLVYANSPLLRQTLRADNTLSQFNRACWVSHFLSGTYGLTHTLLYHEQIQMAVH